MQNLKKGDKVVVKGLDMAFIFDHYISDGEVRLFIEGESMRTPHAVIIAKLGSILPNNEETLISEGWA